MTETPEERFYPFIEYMVFRRCTPGWIMKENTLPICDMTYIIQGKAHYIINGIDYDLGAGDLICLPPNSIREAVTCPEDTMHCFSVNFRLVNANNRRPVSLPFPIVSHTGIINYAVQLFHELSFAWLNKEPGYALKCQGLFMLILHFFYELIVCNIDTSNIDFRIKKIKSYISKHYSEKLPAKKLASLTGLNKIYLNMLFKQETGMTLHQYQIYIRIKNAENMLRSGEFTVYETAEHCGYLDIYHFSKQFKEILGFSPSKCMPRRDSLAGVYDYGDISVWSR
jgi:AraC-like DNA-binding protein